MFDFLSTAIKFILVAILLTPMCLRLFVRRMEYVLLVRNAKRRLPEIEKLARVVGWAFLRKTKKFSSIRWGILPNPGFETTNENTHGPICWEAPIVFLVQLNDGTSLGLAVEFRGSVLCVRQMQGTKGADIPREINHWPLIFMRACIDFAKQNNLREVRLYRADQSGFYWHPVAIPYENGEQWSVAVANLQRRMRQRYDGTAYNLRMIMTRRYGFWTNPNCTRPS